MQTFDSSGPNVKIRGNAFQVFERYVALAREASVSGDRVAAENLYQHAEHYFRIMNANGDAQSQGAPRPTTPADTEMMNGPEPEIDEQEQQRASASSSEPQQQHNDHQHNDQQHSDQQHGDQQHNDQQHNDQQRRDQPRREQPRHEPPRNEQPRHEQPEPEQPPQEPVDN